MGPTVDVKLLIVTDCSRSVHELGDVPMMMILKHSVKSASTFMSTVCECVSVSVCVHVSVCVNGVLYQ